MGKKDVSDHFTLEKKTLADQIADLDLTAPKGY